jgi:hypothetical protein
MGALIGETEFFEFAIENFSAMMGYIAIGNLNIRIHRDITGEMWQTRNGLFCRMLPAKSF